MLNWNNKVVVWFHSFIFDLGFSGGALIPVYNKIWVASPNIKSQWKFFQLTFNLIPSLTTLARFLQLAALSSERSRQSMMPLQRWLALFVPSFLYQTMSWLERWPWQGTNPSSPEMADRSDVRIDVGFKSEVACRGAKYLWPGNFRLAGWKMSCQFSTPKMNVILWCAIFIINFLQKFYHAREIGFALCRPFIAAIMLVAHYHGTRNATKVGPDHQIFWRPIIMEQSHLCPRP